MKLSETERFWSKVDKSGSCWLWTAHTAHGYGRFTSGGRLVQAHRRSFELAGNVIPDGMEIDHICRNPSCVRPEHLRVTTHKRNCENLETVRNSKSGVRGVAWHQRTGRWRAIARHNGREYSAGLYGTVAEAEEAVIALRLRLFTHNASDRTPNMALPA